MKPLRIVIASSFAPQPFGHPPGGRWTDVLLRGLTDRGHHVTMIAPVHSEAQERAVRRRFPASRYDLRLHPVVLEGPVPVRKLRSLAEPHGYAFGAALRRDLRELSVAGWDLLHLEDVWAGWVGLPFMRRRTVLNFHSLYCVDDAPMDPARPREAIVQLLRHRAEARLARAYPTLIGLTSRIQRHLRGLAPAAHVDVCPFGMDLSEYDLLPENGRHGPPVVALMASMHWPPGASAARRLLTRIFPKIRHEIPDARCLIVGWQARSALAAHVGAPGVDIEENVPDIRPYFARADLLLYAPERATGMKIKVLEAFAFGVPVVTNADGVEGIPAVDRVHAGVCEDDDGLAARAVALVRDPDLKRKQRAAARALVESHCAPEPTLDTVERIHAGIVERASA